VPRRSSRASKAPGGSAFDAGLGYLARRAHSRAELRRKLLRRGYDEDDVESAMARLADHGYLDDASFAAGHVRRRSASLGPLALSAELAARGVDRQLARQAVAGLTSQEQLAAATRLVARQPGAEGAASYKELLDSAGTKLLRRGFSPSVAREACRAVWQGTRDASEP
jgi:regulatory protein